MISMLAQGSAGDFGYLVATACLSRQRNIIIHIKGLAVFAEGLGPIRGLVAAGLPFWRAVTKPLRMQSSGDPSASRSPISRQLVTENLRALGIRAGDLLYLRCGLGRVGVRSKDVEDVFLGGIRDAIGSDGTLIAPAFGRTSFRWEKELAVSAPDAVPTTGAFSKLLLNQPGAFRSTHPTHSFVGLGPRAEEVLRDHPEDGACFEPIRAIVEADGVMALIGCVADSPGFSTVHLAQYDLGLSQKHYMKLLLAVRKGGPEGPIHRPVESPGCSRNFGAFYKDYIEDNNFHSGYVGKAWSIAVRAKAAYARERSILERNPRYPVCDQPDCLCCRLTRSYNKRAVPGRYCTAPCG